eukprot:scaffold207920_cov30-Tisochrysis_lutea.AAC.1
MALQRLSNRSRSREQVPHASRLMAPLAPPAAPQKYRRGQSVRLASNGTVHTAARTARVFVPVSTRDKIRSLLKGLSLSPSLPP